MLKLWSLGCPAHVQSAEPPVKWATAAKVPKQAVQLETHAQPEGSRPEQHAASEMQTCRFLKAMDTGQKRRRLRVRA